MIMLHVAKMHARSMCYLHKVLRTQPKIKKNAGASVLRDLNKDNKDMFGKLLETSPQKRKRLSKVLEPEQEKSFQATPSVLEVPYDHLAQDFTLSIDQFKCLSIHEALDPDSGLSVNKAPDTLAVEHKGFIPDVIHKLHLFIGHDAKLALPDSVIRSIPSFPMLNMAGDKSNCPPQVPEVVMKYPSVSKVLSDSKSEKAQLALQRWREKMIREMGDAGFLEYYKESKPLLTSKLNPCPIPRSYHTSVSIRFENYRTALLARGTQFHAMVQNHLLGKPPSIIIPELEGCWSSLLGVVSQVGKVESVEHAVVHPWLLYRGVIDCVAMFNGKPSVIDWKKSDRKKSKVEFTYDAPLQVAAYMGALSFDPSFQSKVKSGVVVMCYTDGSPADVFQMNLKECGAYWNDWLLRLQKFWLDTNLQKEAETIVK